MKEHSDGQKIGIGGLTMFTICAVIILDTLSASAVIGPSALVWWGITLIGFIVPYALVVTELETTWPAKGGIYDWVKLAFGSKFAARTSFLYWINVGLWMPSSYILFVGIFSSLYWPDMNLYFQVFGCLVLIWLTVLFCTFSTQVCLKIIQWGAWAKIIIILSLGIAGLYYAIENGSANNLAFHNFIPKMSEPSQFLPVIIYSLLGLELISSMGSLIKNPRKTIPITMFLSAIAIAFLYLFGTFAILVTIPVNQISIVSGIVDALKIIFKGGLFADIILNILCILTLFTFVSNMVAWVAGSSRTAAEAATNQELPAFLGVHYKRYNTPIGANISTGVVSTLVILCYSQLANSNSELFWVVFSFSSCIFLFPYLFLFLSWITLRYTKATFPRSYRIPGGFVGQWTVAVLSLFFVLQGIILFIFPNIFKLQMDSSHSVPILIGILLTLILEEIFIFNRKKTNIHIVKNNLTLTCEDHK